MNDISENVQLWSFHRENIFSNMKHFRAQTLCPPSLTGSQSDPNKDKVTSAHWRRRRRMVMFVLHEVRQKSQSQCRQKKVTQILANLHSRCSPTLGIDLLGQQKLQWLHAICHKAADKWEVAAVSTLRRWGQVLASHSEEVRMHVRDFIPIGKFHEELEMREEKAVEKEARRNAGRRHSEECSFWVIGCFAVALWVC